MNTSSTMYSCRRNSHGQIL